MTTWTTHSEALPGGTLRLRFEDAQGHTPTRRQSLDLWTSNDDFCATFSSALAKAPMAAAFWETAPLSAGTLNQPFECVLVPSPALVGLRADPQPFAAQFSANTGNVIAFDNLGGDATLIVPRDLGRSDNAHLADYAHLVAFLRSASPAQVRALWRLAGQTAAQWVAAGRTCWISTSGLGVSWLHIRVDARPKYYSHASYRNA